MRIGAMKKQSQNKPNQSQKNLCSLWPIERKGKGRLVSKPAFIISGNHLLSPLRTTIGRPGLNAGPGLSGPAPCCPHTLLQGPLALFQNPRVHWSLFFDLSGVIDNTFLTHPIATILFDQLKTCQVQEPAKLPR